MDTTEQNFTEVLSDQNHLSTRRPVPITIAVNIIGFLAIVGNGFVLTVLGKYPNLLESTRKFCIHLAVTDLGNGILSFVIIYSTMASERNKLDLCIYVLLFVKFFVFASQGIVTVNNFERYVGICKRQAYLRIMKKTTVNILLFLAWCYPVVLVSVSAVGFSPTLHQSSCYYHLMFRKWVYVLEVIIMFTAATVNIILFGFIISKALTFYKKVSPASLQGTSNAAVRNREMKKSIRNGKMMGLVTAAFLVCWMPYNVYQMYVGSGRTVSDNLVSAANSMYLIGVCNSTMNPFIYVWQKKEFRECCKLMFKCKQSQQVTIINANSPASREPACSSQAQKAKSTENSMIGTFRKTQSMITPSKNEESISTIEID